MFILPGPGAPEGSHGQPAARSKEQLDQQGLHVPALIQWRASVAQAQPRDGAFELGRNLHRG